MNARLLKHTIASALALAQAARDFRATNLLYSALITFAAAYAVTLSMSWLGLKASRLLSKHRLE